jgi:predicted thioesterase
MDVSAGHRGEVRSTVTGADTAVALGSGSLPVLATPRLLAWCEAATCRALEGRLPPGSSSVGTTVHLEHLAASEVGAQVTAVALVVSVEGRRIGFDVEATDAGGTVVARGTVERVVVDDARFLARLSRQAASGPGGCS